MPCPRVAGSRPCHRPNRLSQAIGSLWCNFVLSPPGYRRPMTAAVEHLVGQVARFHSLEELLAFMIRMLTEVEEQSDSP